MTHNLSLADIFNLDGNPGHRVKVLNMVFKFAAESDQLDAIQHHIIALDDWVYELKLDNSQTRALIGSLLPGLQNSAYVSLPSTFLRFAVNLVILSCDTSPLLGKQKPFLRLRNLPSKKF